MLELKANKFRLKTYQPTPELLAEDADCHRSMAENELRMRQDSCGWVAGGTPPHIELTLAPLPAWEHSETWEKGRNRPWMLMTGWTESLKRGQALLLSALGDWSRRHLHCMTSTGWTDLHTAPPSRSQISHLRTDQHSHFLWMLSQMVASSAVEDCLYLTEMIQV